MGASDDGESEDERLGDDLARLDWLSVRLRELSSRITLLNLGRPYRDTARAQTLRRLRAQLRGVEARLFDLRQSLDADPGDGGARGQARLLLAVAGLLVVARSSLELVGVRGRWSRDSALSAGHAAKGLTRRGGLDRRARKLRRALDETRAALDGARHPSTGTTRTGIDSARTDAWIELADRSVTLADDWLRRAVIARARLHHFRWTAWGVAGLEAQIDYVAVLTDAAEILCRL